MTDTGDPLIDKWEKQLAEGEVPDLTEAFSEEELDRISRLRKRAQQQIPTASIADTVDAVTRRAKQEGVKYTKPTFRGED